MRRLVLGHWRAGASPGEPAAVCLSFGPGVSIFLAQIGPFLTLDSCVTAGPINHGCSQLSREMVSGLFTDHCHNYLDFAIIIELYIAIDGVEKRVKAFTLFP